MNKPCFILIAILFSTLSACKAKHETMVGDDKDAHGCIPSAGYQWCGKENKCVRSWELAEEKGIEAIATNFNGHCGD